MSDAEGPGVNRRLRTLRPAAGALAAVALLLVIGLLPTGPLVGPPGSGSASRAPTAAAAMGGAFGAASPLPSVAGCGGSLPVPSAPAPLPPVLFGEQRPCVTGHDEAGMSFVSAAPGSGGRFTLALSLPASAGDVVNASGGLFLSLWLSGVPCSYEGLSLLRITLLPEGGGSLGLVNWSVRAPVFDLVPAGACDPACQNGTSTLTLGAMRFCEDDALRSGTGSAAAAPGRLLAAGDRLSLTVVDAALGLGVYLNDSTTPTASRSWSYTSSVSVTGRPLVAAFPTASNTSTGWSYGADVGVGWMNCPSGNGSFVGSSCNSYAGTHLSLPLIDSFDFWNASSLVYNVPYASAQTWSTTGGCSGASGALPCSNFRSGGGSGVYPAFSLGAAAGRSFLEYDASPGAALGGYGGSSAQFASDGAATTLSTAVLSSIVVSPTNLSIPVHIRASDPRGVARVEVGALWCFNPTTLVPISTLVNATRNPGVLNTTYDGNWTYNFGRGNTSTGGAFYLWARAESAGGDWTPYTIENVSIAGTGGTCGPPAYGPSVITSAVPISSGYLVDWFVGSTQAPIVANFTIWANVTGSPALGAFVGAPAARSGTIHLAPSTAYNVWVSVTFVTGFTLGTTTTFFIRAVPTLAVLAATAEVPAPELSGWLGSLTVNVSVNLTGGSVPYHLVVAFGDGQSAFVNTSAATASVSHQFTSYSGGARILAEVSDGVADRASAAPIVVEVRATPLGLVPRIAAGDGFLNVSWPAPVSPVAPVSNFTVLVTQTPGLTGVLAAFWSSNSSLGGNVTVWNTSRPWAILAAPDLVPSYVEVIARNVFGWGLLPAAPSYRSAVPAPLAIVSLAPPSGGPAPFTGNFSAFLTTGTSDVLVQALYAAYPGPFVPGIVTQGAASAWVNASLTFPSPGLFAVTLHVSDEFGDVAAETVRVYVGPGTAPAVYVNETSPAAYVGRPVSFAASVGGGGGGIGFLWSFGDGTTVPGGPQATHVYSIAGRYTVSVTATNNSTGGVTVTSIPVPVYALPSVAIAESVAAVGSLSAAFTAIVSGGDGVSTVVWSFSDGGQATGSSVTHTFASDGVYEANVTVTDANGVAAHNSTSFAVGSAASTAPAASGVPLWVAGGLGAATAVLLATTILLWARGRRPSGPSPLREAGPPEDPPAS